MNEITEHEIPTYWFVGSCYDHTDDQLPRFLADGIWENGYDNDLLDTVKTMRVDDYIAIKASYTRKNGLPFDNRGQYVSVMSIKATGRITENFNDGKRVRIDWVEVDPVREWYFFTNRGTIWHVEPGDWRADNLIEFTFEGKPQDIERFCNAPFWRERFGTPDANVDQLRFAWTKFYEAIADKLLDFRTKRADLVNGLHAIAEQFKDPNKPNSYLTDQFSDGTSGPLKDICPFTAMGMFNRGITTSNR